MPYTPSIPATGHSGSDDYVEMQQNFDQIQTSFSIDHMALASGGATEGYHKQVHFASNNVPASPTTYPTIFSNNDAFAVPQVFYYTGTAAQSANQYVAAAKGSTMCFGGIILKWGNKSVTSSQVINFAAEGVVAFPHNCFAAFVTPENNNNTYNVLGVGSTQFTIATAGAGTQTVYWFAIGN